MNVFDSIGSEYEQVVFGHDPMTGMRTIIAVYSTALGPALGGTRMWPFATEEEALRDVLRLAKGMAYKSSAAGLDLGGGKAVLIADPKTEKSRELFHAYARVVNGMGGAYITTADVGTNVADLETMAEVSSFVTGTQKGSGDPSPLTAFGVLNGLYTVAEELWGDRSLRGKRIVVQGAGKVGSGVVRYLAEEGARIIVSDIDTEAAGNLAAEVGGDTVEASRALAVECDILVPCALGAIVNDATLPDFACKAIAGAANNQLERPEHAGALVARGILYAPDYVVNAGGVINVADELQPGGYDADRAHAKTAAIGDRLREVFIRAREEKIFPAAAADAIAGDRIAQAEARRGY